MNKIALAAIAGALAFLATPASAGYSSHGHGHSYGHSHYAPHYSHHSYQPSHSYHSHSYHQPTYTHGYVQPTYQAHYVEPVHVEPKVTYEKRHAYVYQKVAGYCVDVVKSYGYNQHRKTVECKAGEYQKPEAPEHKKEEPAPAPAPEAPVEQK